LDYLTTQTSLSPIWRGFAPGFVNYKNGCTRLATASDKVYQLLAHGLWFSPASSTTKTGRHDIAEILLKVALNTKNQSINQYSYISLFNKFVSDITERQWFSPSTRVSSTSKTGCVYIN
jgi:hypothetical protein